MVDLLVTEDIISLKVNLLQSKIFFLCYLLILHTGFLVGLPGTDPEFQVGGGGGGALKMFGVYRVKNHDFTPKNHLISNFRVRPSPGSAPVTQSLVLYACFVDRCLSFCTFSFGHCVVCSSLLYGFQLRLWYLRSWFNRFILY